MVHGRIEVPEVVRRADVDAGRGGRNPVHGFDVSRRLAVPTLRILGPTFRVIECAGGDHLGDRGGAHVSVCRPLVQVLLDGRRGVGVDNGDALPIALEPTGTNAVRAPNLIRHIAANRQGQWYTLGN